MELRIIKEESVYRIQQYNYGKAYDGDNKCWDYASKAIESKGGKVISQYTPIDFKTKKEAEDFIEHNYIIKVVKEYEVESKQQ